MIPELRRVTRWRCPNCAATDVTTEPRPHTRMHACPGLNGITAPYVEEGVDCKVVATERDDYVNGELVTLDGAGRAIMNVRTIRADGSNDCYVMAPTATLQGEI